jgi:hypothetical protein
MGKIEEHRLNPLASLCWQAGLFCTFKLVESGDCCAICNAVR